MPVKMEHPDKMIRHLEKYKPQKLAIEVIKPEHIKLKW